MAAAMGKEHIILPDGLAEVERPGQGPSVVSVVPEPTIVPAGGVEWV